MFVQWAFGKCVSDCFWLSGIKYLFAAWPCD